MSWASVLVGGGSQAGDFSSDCGREFLMPWDGEAKVGTIGWSAIICGAAGIRGYGSVGI